MSSLAVTRHRTKAPDGFQSLMFHAGPDSLRALEACCGHRREWHREKPRRTTFGDLLIDVRPEVVLDFKALPFREDSFDVIFFDPPHLIRSEKWNQLSDRYLHFGHWETRRQWEEALDAVNSEFARVARSGAVLHVKIIDGKDRRVTKLADLERLTNWQQESLALKDSRIPWSTCQTVRATYRKVS